MLIKDVMTSSVVTVTPNDDLTKISKEMSDNNIGVVPVCENGNLLGVITDRDIVIRCIAQEKDPKSVKAKEIMTSQAVSISPNSSVEAASTIMANAQYRRLMVTEAGKIVGVVSLGDLSKIKGFREETAKALTEISKDKYFY